MFFEFVMQPSKIDHQLAVAKKMHIMQTTNMFGYTPVPSVDPTLYDTPPGLIGCMNEMLYNFITQYRIDADADLCEIHKSTIQQINAGATSLEAFNNHLTNFIIVAYFETVVNGDAAYLKNIVSYVNSLGDDLVEMYPSHPMFKKHLRAIADDYASCLEKLADRIRKAASV